MAIRAPRGISPSDRRGRPESDAGFRWHWSSRLEVTLELRHSDSGKTLFGVFAMGKLVGIVLLVAAFWVGAEISTHGTEGAFGGLFSSDHPVQDLRSTPQRVGDNARRSMQAGEDRVNRILDE